MEFRRLGSDGPEVSVICLGTMTFGTPVGEADAIKLTRQALDLGINFIDTANMYEGYTRYIGSPGGVSERFLGKALEGRREGVILATKVGMKVGEAPEDEGASPAAIRKHLDKSLQRLATDYVDIYYLHKPDPNVPPAETLGALDEAIRAGKARHYGISNFSAEETRELLNAAAENNLPRPVVHQPPFSLLNRGIEEDLLPLCVRENIGVVPYQVLQGGLLTGKYRRGDAPPEGSRMSENKKWLPEPEAGVYDELERLEAEARAKGRTLLEHTIVESLSTPGITSLIVGAKRIEQIEGVVKAAELLSR